MAKWLFTGHFRDPSDNKLNRSDEDYLKADVRIAKVNDTKWHASV